MKVFVSYSFVDSELHLLTLLLEKLRNQGHIVETSNLYDNINQPYIMPTKNKIITSDYFIGIVTNNSNSINDVVDEWSLANLSNIKNVLLVENGVRIDDLSLQFIRFDRYNPKAAIDRLFQIQKSKNSGLDNALIGAGIVLGIAALLSLLSDSDN